MQTIVVDVKNPELAQAFFRLTTPSEGVIPKP
jgi:hypothetical protein